MAQVVSAVNANRCAAPRRSLKRPARTPDIMNNWKMSAGSFSM